MNLFTEKNNKGQEGLEKSQVRVSVSVAVQTQSTVTLLFRSINSEENRI